MTNRDEEEGKKKTQRNKSGCVKVHRIISQDALGWTSPFDAELGVVLRVAPHS